MAETSYTYSLSTDFPEGKVDGSRLKLEIDASAITVQLARVDTAGDAVSVVMKAALSTEEQEALDDVVSNHSGEPLPEPVDVIRLDEPRSPEGLPLFAPSFLHTSEQARLRGYPLSCAPDEISIIDIEVTSQMLVQKGQFWIENGRRGDLAQFSIVDKNDTLGLHSLHGIPLGTPIELVRYVEDYPVPTKDLWDDDLVMPTVAPVVPGLFLRAQYEAGPGGTTRHLGITFRWYVNMGGG